MKTRIMAIFVLTAFVLGFSTPVLYAGHGHHSMSNFHDMSLDDKFFMKAHFMLENYEELGLSEDQVKAIKDLKLETKKYLVKQNAEIELLHLDIESMLMQPNTDVPGIHKLIDQKMALKTARSKQLVEHYAKLKNILSEDQKTAAKKIWMEKMKHHGHKRM